MNCKPTVRQHSCRLKRVPYTFSLTWTVSTVGDRLPMSRPLTSVERQGATFIEETLESRRLLVRGPKCTITQGNVRYQKEGQNSDILPLSTLFHRPPLFSTVILVSFVRTFTVTKKDRWSYGHLSMSKIYYSLEWLEHV